MKKSLTKGGKCDRINLLIGRGRQIKYMREWLSGRASPCQGERREFESRLPLQNATSLLTCRFFFKIIWEVLALKKNIKRLGAFFGAEATGIFISLILGFAMTVFISDSKIVSVITSLIYIATLYSVGWNEGRRDSRKVGESFPDLKGIFVAALICGGFTLLLLLIRIVVYHTNPTSWGPYGEGHEMILVRSGALVICDVIYRLLNYYFVGFMTSGTLLSYSIPVVVPVVVFPLSYKVGLTRFSVIEKFMPQLLYKPKKKK